MAEVISLAKEWLTRKEKEKNTDLLAGDTQIIRLVFFSRYVSHRFEPFARHSNDLDRCSVEKETIITTVSLAHQR